MYWILSYHVVPDYLERRPAFRSLHLAMAQEAQARGELLMAGAHGDPPDGATLVFIGPDGSAAQRFAEHDPYVLNGLVTDWQVRPWHVVVGGAERDEAP
jgi:uncharacterized protein